MWTDIVRMMNNFRLCRSSATGSFLSHFLNYQIVSLVCKNYKIFLLYIDNQNYNPYSDTTIYNPIKRHHYGPRSPKSKSSMKSMDRVVRGKAKHISIAFNCNVRLLLSYIEEKNSYD